MDLNNSFGRDAAMQPIINRRNAEFQASQPTPSSPSRPSSFDPQTADVVDQFRAGVNAPGGGIATGAGLAARSLVGGAVSNFVDSAQQFGDLVKPIYQGARAFVTGNTGTLANAAVDPSLSQPRRTDFGMNDRGAGYSPLAGAAAAIPQGPISTNIGSDGTVLPAGIMRTGNSYSGVGGVDGVSTGTAQQPMTTDQANQYFGSQLAAMNAREDQNVQAGRESQLALAARGTAQQASQTADREASVANFLAKNGADVVGGVTYRGTNPARTAAALAAGGATARAAGARGVFNAADANLANAGKQNYIDDFARSQQAELAGKTAAGAMQGQQVQQQTAQLDLAARKQVAALDQQIAAEKDPMKLQLLQSKRLALIGKGAAPKIAVIDSDGPPDMMGNPTVRKVAIDTTTGQIFSGQGAQSASGKFPAPVAASIQHLKDNPGSKAEFEKFYGPGSAAQFLKN